MSDEYLPVNGSNGFVTINGVQVAADWPERIREGQELGAFVIGGREYARIRFGAEKEDWGANDGPCHDCAVVKGQLHVLGCDVERCPRCGGQVISCGCPYEGDDSEA